MEDNIGNENNEIYSDRVRAGKRTYFFDVRSTRGGDYYVTITESKRVYKDADGKRWIYQNLDAHPSFRSTEDSDLVISCFP